MPLVQFTPLKGVPFAVSVLSVHWFLLSAHASRGSVFSQWTKITLGSPAAMSLSLRVNVRDEQFNLLKIHQLLYVTSMTIKAA